MVSQDDDDAAGDDATMSSLGGPDAATETTKRLESIMASFDAFDTDMKARTAASSGESLAPAEAAAPPGVVDPSLGLRELVAPARRGDAAAASWIYPVERSRRRPKRSASPERDE